MKPDVTDVLADLAQRLAGEIAPQVQPAYLAGTLGMTAGLLSAVKEEFDRAAHRRVEENTAIRSLFGKAEGLALDPGLAERLASLAATKDGDLRVSALEASNATLRGALIALHAAIETMGGAQAEALNAAIWAELTASTERRRLSAGNI